MMASEENFPFEITSLRDEKPWESWTGALADHLQQDPTTSIEWRRFFPTDKAYCGITRVPPGQRLPYHRHKPAEVYFPKKGSCTLLIDGQKRTIGAGSLDSVYIPSNCPHGLINEGKEDFEFFYIYLPESKPVDGHVFNLEESRGFELLESPTADENQQPK